jgi:mRNA interferase RelE/StbE
MSKGQIYRIEIERSPEKAIARLSANIQRRIRHAIDQLATNPRPRGCIKLQGQDDTYYRIRVGDWRVIYFVDDDKLIVLVVEFGARGGVYDKW